MKLFAFVVLGSFLLSCGGGGGVSSGGIPEDQACQQAAATFCQKIYGCQDATSKLIQGILMGEPACETTILANCGSTAFHCGAGMTYHPDQALACKNEFNGQKCETISANIATAVQSGSIAAAVPAITANLPVCAAICSTP